MYVGAWENMGEGQGSNAGGRKELGREDGNEGQMIRKDRTMEAGKKDKQENRTSVGLRCYPRWT